MSPLGHGRQLCEYYSNPTCQQEVMAWTFIYLGVHCALDPGVRTLDQGHDTPFGH